MAETKKSKSKWYWVSVAILTIAATLAVACVARILGWLTGASQSPVVAVVIPLIFGLLAVFGLIKEVPSPFGSTSSVWQTVFASLLIVAFCYVYFDSVALGTFDRAGEYHELYELLDTAWSKIDPETLAALQRLRIRARLANLPAADFEPIILDVIRPLVASDLPDKEKRTETILTKIEAALPSPAISKGDESA